MHSCTTHSNPTQKACSGKCKSSACAGAPRVWVLGACEGMITLFEKNSQGALQHVSQQDQAVFSSLEQFQKFINQGEASHVFDQLVIVGSSSDIAWIHASLPESVKRYIAAEIKYPLLPAWFKQALPMTSLTHALESVFTS